MTTFWQGAAAIARKESLHMLQDRLTLALILTVPFVQIMLFGYAINLNPKDMPTAVVAAQDDTSVVQVLDDLKQIGYFNVIAVTAQAEEADRWLAESKIQFIVRLDPDTGTTVAQNQARITLIADATDPVASIAATQAAAAHFTSVLDADAAVDKVTVEKRFNPEGASRLFIVPGLLGVVLTLTLVLLGALSLVRERERGTFETLMTLPLSRGAILLGKLVPYFVLGCALFLALLVACTMLLGLPWHGVSPALAVTVAVFVCGNLTLGIALSLIARNQMQAMQLGIFFYLPSMLLSGFMFPFYGMPAWARTLGEMLPLTHFLRVVRGVLLKNLPDIAVWHLAAPIAGFAVITSALAVALYRRRIA